VVFGSYRGGADSDVACAANEVRYANISIIEGIGASQHGIGMVSARIAEIILRDERTAIPIGSYNPAYGVTLSLPSIVGREGVLRTLEPELNTEERQGLLRSVDTLKAALCRIRKSELRPA
jgi:L-lactate dehydrogenase